MTPRVPETRYPPDSRILEAKDEGPSIQAAWQPQADNAKLHLTGQARVLFTAGVGEPRTLNYSKPTSLNLCPAYTPGLDATS